mgnify:CR=1 FL=1
MKNKEIISDSCFIKALYPIYNPIMTKRISTQYTLFVESLRIISILLYPFIPETSEKINKQLGVKLGLLKDCKFGLIKNYNVKKGGILFKKV